MLTAATLIVAGALLARASTSGCGSLNSAAALDGTCRPAALNAATPAATSGRTAGIHVGGGAPAQCCTTCTTETTLASQLRFALADKCVYVPRGARVRARDRRIEFPKAGSGGGCVVVEGELAVAGIDSGANNDCIVVNGGRLTVGERGIDLGKGADTIQVTAHGGVLDSAGGVFGKEGDDRVHVSAGGVLRAPELDTDRGADLVQLTGSESVLAVRSKDLQMSEGDDTLIIDDDAKLIGSAYMGNGDDQVTVATSGVLSGDARMGFGDDQVQVCGETLAASGSGVRSAASISGQVDLGGGSAKSTGSPRNCAIVEGSDASVGGGIRFEGRQNAVIVSNGGKVKGGIEATGDRYMDQVSLFGPAFIRGDINLRGGDSNEVRIDATDGKVLVQNGGVYMASRKDNKLDVVSPAPPDPSTIAVSGKVVLANENRAINTCRIPSTGNYRFGNSDTGCNTVCST